MTTDRKGLTMLAALETQVGGLQLLRMAVVAGDPTAELLFRIDDMLREMKAALAKSSQDREDANGPV